RVALFVIGGLDLVEFTLGAGRHTGLHAAGKRPPACPENRGSSDECGSSGRTSDYSEIADAFATNAKVRSRRNRYPWREFRGRRRLERHDKNGGRRGRYGVRTRSLQGRAGGGWAFHHPRLKRYRARQAR